MLTSDDLPLLTDGPTASRGRAYARTGHVVEVTRHGADVEAVVVGSGSAAYRVRLTATDGQCTCPVGAFCKHCAAVVIAIEEGLVGADTPDLSDDTDVAWLRSLDPDALARLVEQAMDAAPGFRDFVTGVRASSTGDVTALTEQVEEWLSPRRRFYDYYQANEYASQAQGVVDLVEEFARTPTPALLPVIERAITLSVRTILVADDSSGLVGDVVRTLLDTHQRAAAGLGGRLDAKDTRRLATWLHKFMFSGKQDFFEVDVDRYGAALGETGIARYASLVAKSQAATGLTDDQLFAGHVYGQSQLQYARQRLAIWARDPEEILKTCGGPPQAQYQAVDLAQAFDDAGLPRQAVRWASVGYALAPTHHHDILVNRLVVDAEERGDLADATRLRHEHFLAVPSTTTYTVWRSAAKADGTWSDVTRLDAESYLRNNAPSVLLEVLLAEDRDDEAWDLATAAPSAVHGWGLLLDRRQLTHPHDVIPYRRARVTDALKVANKRNYAIAAEEMRALKAAAAAAGPEAAVEFEQFLTETLDANRRRPTCIDTFRRKGLL
ncbi:MAG: SWIM zinc finger family protein [Cellulomonas sp.]|nr:SWIM zinc finger family protein [Cellulomonas sp.]